MSSSGKVAILPTFWKLEFLCIYTTYKNFKYRIYETDLYNCIETTKKLQTMQIIATAYSIRLRYLRSKGIYATGKRIDSNILCKSAIVTLGTL